ncbi:MAG: HEAT repeat domain-containing protein [Candidatus Ratteibacteria bacterium]|nr:HEAT repeat domain-containing protein [Candidatus Ratteibacteria bacterium]
MKKILLLLMMFILGCSLFADDITLAKIQTEAEYPYLPADVKALVDRTFSIDATERAEAAYQLGRLGPKAEKASPFLIKMLDDNSPVFCRYNGYGVWSTAGKEAARALVKIGKPSLKYLISVLENKHPYISIKPDMQRNIIIYLTELSGENFGNDLSKWTNWIMSQLQS